VESTGKQPNQPEHPTLSPSLLDGAQQMNADSWSRLVTTFGPIVYGWCRSSGIGEADSPDVVQNVFASVAGGICSFQPKKDQGSFRSWLATITRNKVRDYFRKRARSEVAEGGTTAWQRLQEEPDKLESTICPENARGGISHRVLESVRNEFETMTWTAFWMTAVDGKTAAEVSEATGMTVASVYQAKSRVLRRLRQRLAETPE
jgi:RNA polymerase sigma-70 factor (ECF subfamily)